MQRTSIFPMLHDGRAVRAEIPYRHAVLRSPVKLDKLEPEPRSFVDRIENPHPLPRHLGTNPITRNDGDFSFHAGSIRQAAGRRYSGTGPTLAEGVTTFEEMIPRYRDLAR